jgi:hypothetical protein
MLVAPSHMRLPPIHKICALAQTPAHPHTRTPHLHTHMHMHALFASRFGNEQSKVGGGGGNH